MKRTDPSPSPWSYDPAEFGITGGPIRDAEGLEVARVYRLADARVIAASPELYAACAQMRDQHALIREICHCIICEAARKAEGAK